MGKRLSKIYTRTGDQGTTGLGDGSRVNKTHPRIEAIGEVDELNSSLGLLIELLKKEENTQLTPVIDFLRNHQHRIFDLGGELSIPGYTLINNDQVKAIESFLDELNNDLEPLENFILPGGSVLISQCHLARSVCRRAERRVLALADAETVNPVSLQFLNRFSDCLFVIARYCAKGTLTAEVLWQKQE